jgi:hypothetical protein
MPSDISIKDTDQNQPNYLEKRHDFKGPDNTDIHVYQYIF